MLVGGEARARVLLPVRTSSARAAVRIQAQRTCAALRSVLHFAVGNHLHAIPSQAGGRFKSPQRAVNIETELILTQERTALQDDLVKTVDQLMLCVENTEPSPGGNHGQRPHGMHVCMKPHALAAARVLDACAHAMPPCAHAHPMHTPCKLHAPPVDETGLEGMLSTYLDRSGATGVITSLARHVHETIAAAHDR